MHSGDADEKSPAYLAARVVDLSVVLGPEPRLRAESVSGAENDIG